MPKSKREQMLIAEWRAKVAALYLQGHKQFEIARMPGLEGDAGAMVVSRDLAAVKKAHAASALRDYDFAKGQLLSEIGLLKRELWASWELSRKGKGGVPRFAAQILSCLGEEATLLGLRAKPGEVSTVPPMVAFRIHVPSGYADGTNVDGVVTPSQPRPVAQLTDTLKSIPPGANPNDYEWDDDDGLATQEEAGGQ